MTSLYFKVYIAEVECDVNKAVTRNIHKWKEPELKTLVKSWESTPDHFNKLDLRGFLQDKEITQVEMEDAEPDQVPDDLNDKKKESESDEVSSLFSY